jgi:hypothetical protein
MSSIRFLPGGGQIFFCPACNLPHQVNARPLPHWPFNWDIYNPTFKGSIAVHQSRGTIEGGDRHCHSEITDGMIFYYEDSTHGLAGKTLRLPEWPYEPHSFGGILEPE